MKMSEIDGLLYGRGESVVFMLWHEEKLNKFFTTSYLMEFIDSGAQQHSTK